MRVVLHQLREQQHHWLCQLGFKKILALVEGERQLLCTYLHTEVNDFFFFCQSLSNAFPNRLTNAAIGFLSRCVSLSHYLNFSRDCWRTADNFSFYYFSVTSKMCNCKLALKGNQSHGKSGSRGHCSGEKILLLIWHLATRRKGCRQLHEGAGEIAAREGTSHDVL